MSTIEFSEVTKQFDDGTTAIQQLTLLVEDGEFLILVGPSGCGKTTALRMVAGLEEVTSGEIRIGERVINDLPPAQRDIAMVFQNYALYPHMTVRQNIAFPLRQKGVKKAEIAERVRDASRQLAIGQLLDRTPRELSGGQRQRVAIGRALVRRPAAFLMDEPLSNLDAKLRVQMRAELIALHRRLGVTTIYVTHDQTEAMTLGDRVVVMNDGVVQQVDTPAHLYRHPANIFVAGFIGSPSMNLLRGTLEMGHVQLGHHRVELTGATRDALAGRTGDVIVGIRPEGFVSANGDGIPGQVAFAEQLGSETLVHFRSDALQSTEPNHSIEAPGDAVERGKLLVARFAPTTTFAVEERLSVQVSSQELLLFDAVSGAALN
jgi:multiple sugar transport system ATP-binding protein